MYKLIILSSHAWPILHLLSLDRSNHLSAMLGCPKLQIPNALPCARCQLAVRDGHCHARTNQCRLDMSLFLVNVVRTRVISCLQACRPILRSCVCRDCLSCLRELSDRAHQTCLLVHHCPNSRSATTRTTCAVRRGAVFRLCSP